MKVLLIGSGAVGLAIGAALYDGNIDVDIIARGNTRESIIKNGIIRRGIFKTITVPAERVRVFETPNQTGNSGYDYILVCAKTTGNPEIAAELAKCGQGLLNDQGGLILCQNGFRNEQYYFSCLDKQKIYTASFAIGFKRPEPYISEVTVFSSPITIGSLFDGDLGTLNPLIEALENGDLPAKSSTEIAKTLWAKMLYNCALNPLSAVLHVAYGGLAQSQDAVLIMNQLIEEIFAVIQAAGYSTFWPDAAVYKKAFYEKILPPTYQHRSSTLQDMERRIKTEIDSLSGVIVELGREYQVGVPYNTMIYHMIKTMESLY
ncbi:MAG TPA: 2-dehydropantoate 2-reductase [Firmicutes bacterium]|jgi:2-dehydropantoate 2-reductase|nr:2-dehydropantoate 2-reductase [Bacillota bacterium]